MSLIDFDPSKYATTTANSAPVKEQGRFGDVVDSVQAGAASGLGGIFDFVGASGLAKSLYGLADDQYSQMSQRGQDSMAKSIFTNDENGDIALGEGATDLDTWLLGMANVAGQFIPTAIPGAGLAGAATKAASLGAKGAKVAQAVGMGATGGSAATGQAMEQARGEVMKIPDNLLADSSIFAQKFLDIDKAQPQASDADKWNEAKKQLAEQVASEVRADPKVLLANFAASAIGDPIIGRALTGARLAKSGAFRSAIYGGVTEGATEAVQAGTSQYGVDDAVSAIDNRNPMANVAQAALNDAALGGGFGAGAGFTGGLLNRAAKPPATNPSADPIRESNPGLASAMDSMTQQAEARKEDLAPGPAPQQPIFNEQQAAQAYGFNDNGVNLDQPAAARRAGMGDTMQAGAYGDQVINRDNTNRGRSFPVVPGQNVSSVAQAVNDVRALGDNRVTGEWLGPENQGRSAASGLLSASPIDSETMTAQRAREATAAQDPTPLTQSNTIFGQDGRPQQAAQAFADNAARNTDNQPKQITDKGIIFANDQSGVTVKGNGQPFSSPKEALSSKNARQAKRDGIEIEAVKLPKGYGWTGVKKQEPINAATDNQVVAVPTDAEATTINNDIAVPKVDTAAITAEPAADLSGDKINKEWTAFAPETGTLNIPRAEMPQIKSEHRGAMVNFMTARGIDNTKEEVQADSLKPTQTEFSPEKVKKAMGFTDNDRSILVSSDNYVLDGHHQWLAKRENKEPIKVIRLNAPIKELVTLANEFPSSNKEADTQQVSNQKTNAQSEKPITNSNDTTNLPAVLRMSKTKWVQAEAKAQGIKNGSPGFDSAIAKINESYEPAIDKALAESSFETYQKFNNDTPESINRMAYDELRKEFDVTDKAPTKQVKQDGSLEQSIQDDVEAAFNELQGESNQAPKKGTEPKAGNVQDDAEAIDLVTPEVTPNTKVVADKNNADTKPLDPIADFGEKLGGAKKDTWGGFDEAIKDDHNTSELPLSKSWPEPDYKALEDGGADKEILALIAAMRAEIPAKPRLNHKVKRWSDNVNMLKGFARALLSGALPKDETTKGMSLKSGELKAIVRTAKVLAKADTANLKSIADYRIRSGSFGVFNSIRYNPEKVFYFITRNGRTDYNNSSDKLSDVEAALEKIISKEQSADKAGKQSNVSVYSDRYTKQVFLGWKGSSGVLRIQNFESLNEAREYLKDNRQDVEAKLAKIKSTPNERRAVNNARIGPERFAGNVTPEIFAEAFGFRGVEFGNWVEQGKRQKDLNQAYDGLMDLADLLGVDPLAISLNGDLGLAFGARGSGGANPAAAHYERGKMVINLTKKNGSGSLAHEWYHALDNYLSKQRGDSGSFISERPYELTNKGVRKELLAAFKTVQTAIHKSDMVKRSKELDKRRSKAYWSTDAELGARSFESFIISELDRKGFANDYLANVVPEDGWMTADENTPDYPYPTKSEQAAIDSAYQQLFDTIDTKKTDSGIEFFSKDNKPNKSKGTLSRNMVDRVVSNTMKKLHGGGGITVKVINSIADFEQHLKLPSGSLSDGVIYGAYDEKRHIAYIIADSHSTTEELRQTVTHEVLAHGGLQGTIGGDKYQSFIDRILASRGKKDFADIWDKIDKDYAGVSDRIKAEEVFANFVQNQPETGSVKQWWNALLTWLRRQLEQVGVLTQQSTKNDMLDMINAITKGFKREQDSAVTPSSNNSDMAYSKGEPANTAKETASDLVFSKTADEPDTRTAKEKLGITEQTKETVSEKIKQNYHNTADTLKSAPFWQRMNEGIFDGLSGIKNAEVAAGITDPNQMGYVSARLASGLADVLHGTFHYGAPVWKDGVVQRKENTKGLLEVLGTLPEGELNNWLAWMGANRAKQLKAEGRENNLTQADIDELLALADGKEAEFEAVRTEYNKINSAVLDMAQEAGLLSQAQRDSFDEEYYVPFFREMDQDPEMQDIASMVVAPFTKKGLAGQSAKIKELKGGKQSTKDLLENIIHRQATMIDASLKNKAMIEISDNLDGTGFMASTDSAEFAELSQAELNKIQRVKVMRDGKPTTYVVSDPSLLRGLMSVNDAGSRALLNRVGRAAKRFLTTGITLSPDFIFKNFIRDAAQAWMINKDDFKLGTDSIKGMKKAFKEDEHYRDLIFSGAAFQGGYVHGADPEAAAQQVRRALREKGLTKNETDNYLKSIANSGLSLLERYRNASDKLENANRLATYESALNAGKSRRQAAYESKDLMDYSLKGNFTLISTMIDFLPFFNARLQGLSKLVRASAAGDNDRVIKVLSANLAMKGIKVAAFSLALAAMNDDDDRYKELPDWDKDTNWHFWLGDDHIRVPKPFELGIVFGTLPERLFGFGTGSQTGNDLGKSLFHALSSTLALNPVPQFAMPVVETWLNYSFFKDTKIEGMGDENRLPGDRYNTYTSDTARELGQALNLSPKKIEHWIKGYTGTLGGYVLGMSDIIARQMLGTETAETPISRYPVIKAFYGGDAPAGSTYFQSEFYDALDNANQVYGSYKRAMEEQDSSRMMELLEDNRDKLGTRIALNRVQRQVSKLSKQQQVVSNSNASSTEKRKQLDELTRQKNAIYQAAYIGFKLREW